jgi:hypothetical protein
VCKTSKEYYNFVVIHYRDEAEMEYLKIAQDLEMYGVNYFQIKVCSVVHSITADSNIQ